MGNIREQSITYLTAAHIEQETAAGRSMALAGGLKQSAKPSPLPR